jgi:hypothetical protein
VILLIVIKMSFAMDKNLLIAHLLRFHKPPDCLGLRQGIRENIPNDLEKIGRDQTFAALDQKWQRARWFVLTVVIADLVECRNDIIA